MCGGEERFWFLDHKKFVSFIVFFFFGVTRGVCLTDFSEEQEVFCSLKFFFSGMGFDSGWFCVKRF